MEADEMSKKIEAHDRLLWRKRNGRDGGLIPTVNALEDAVNEIRVLAKRIWLAVILGLGGAVINVLFGLFGVKP